MIYIRFILILLSCVIYSDIGSAMHRGGHIDEGRGLNSDSFFYFTLYEEVEDNVFIEINVEGALHTTANGDSYVTWMWIIEDDNSIELIPIIPDALGEPYYECNFFTIGSRRVIDIRAVNYGSKYPTTTNRKGITAQPIPDGVVILERPPMSIAKDGWNWGGWMVSFSYLDGEDRGDSGSECAPPNPGPNGERYTIPLNEREVLIIIITEEGLITILLYRLGDDGCWRFGASPSLPTPPPGLSVPQTMPLVMSEYLIQLQNGHFLNAPPFPVY